MLYHPSHQLRAGACARCGAQGLATLLGPCGVSTNVAVFRGFCTTCGASHLLEIRPQGRAKVQGTTRSLRCTGTGIEGDHDTLVVLTVDGVSQ